MMKKMYFFLLTICIIGVACKKNESNDLDKKISLANTKWKLEGIVDTETGALKELKPKDCEECYTLTFNTDSTATAIGIWMLQELHLLHLDPPEFLEDVLWCEKYDKDGEDYCDSNDFRKAIILTESYTVTSDELKLYYGHKYLLFKNYSNLNQ